MALASPSYLALTYDLVGREDLANAVALNSTQFQLSRVVGPALAGVGFTLFGLAGCFYVNGLSFIAVVVSLGMVRPEPGMANPGVPAHSVRDRRALWRDLLDGFRYVKTRPRVFTLLIISAVNSLFGAPYFALIPIYARDVFHLGATGLAWLMGMAGAGAFCGAVFLTILGDFRRKGWFVLGGSLAFGISVIAFALSTRLKLSCLFLFTLGFAIVTSVAAANTLLQKLVTDQMRGRVMSMFLLSFMGTMPIGNILAGSASHHFGVPHTLAAGGLVIVIFAITMMIFNERLRDLY
jgi:predicted MFS family arabinose efflux permease